MKGINGLFNNLCSNLSTTRKTFQQGLKKGVPNQDDKVLTNQ